MVCFPQLSERLQEGRLGISWPKHLKKKHQQHVFLLQGNTGYELKMISLVRHVDFMGFSVASGLLTGSGGGTNWRKLIQQSIGIHQVVPHFLVFQSCSLQQEAGSLIPTDWNDEMALSSAEIRKKKEKNHPSRDGAQCKVLSPRLFHLRPWRDFDVLLEAVAHWVWSLTSRWWIPIQKQHMIYQFKKTV